MDWTLAQIRAKVRSLTGEADTTQLSNADLDLLINDYFCNKFPLEASPQELETDFTLTTQPTDDGEYLLSAAMLLIDKPLYVNNEKIWLTEDRKRFFDMYHEDYGNAFCITKAGLAVGTDATKVANSAFSFRIGNYTYPKAAAETALSGSTIPQNKYGAWRLEVASDGTISVVEASLNQGSRVIGSDLNEYRCKVSHTSTLDDKPVTGANWATYWEATGGSGSQVTWQLDTAYSATGQGYPTAAQAIAGLPIESSANAAMGFVTAINTGGTFVPGTTELSASGVTATYTDGFNSTRNKPVAALLRGRVLTVRPKPDDLYILKAPVALKRPTALSGTSDKPDDPLWGPVIAYGTALERKIELGDAEAIQKLVGPYQYHLGFINRKVIRQMSRTRHVKRTF